MSSRYLLMAGGTGGHIFPAMAVAKELMLRDAKIHWLGTTASMEARIVPKENITFHTLGVKGFRGKGILQKIYALFLFFCAVVQAINIIRTVNPDVVVGFGGFVAAPGGIAARVLNKPLLIHEQNSVAGSTNKLLAKIAHITLEAFPNSLPNAVHIGNPVRQAIVELGKIDHAKANSNNINVLVIGGSLGAKAINDVVPFALEKMNSIAQLNIWHQAGKNKTHTVVEDYKQCHLDARIDEFIQDMAEAYQWADVLICRAGALTVSEVAVVGLPVIFIPLPSAIDNHQYHNAKWLVDHYGALVLQQKNLSAENLSTLLIELINDKQRLQVMQKNAKKIALPNAVDRMVHYCESLTLSTSEVSHVK